MICSCGSAIDTQISSVHKFCVIVVSQRWPLRERERERESVCAGKCSYVYQKILQGKFGLIICKVLYPIKVIVKFDHNFSVVSNLGRLYSELLFFWGDFINQIPWYWSIRSPLFYHISKRFGFLRSLGTASEGFFS